MNPSNPQASWIGFAVSAVVIVVVLGLRMRRLSRERPLKIEQMWIIPAIYGVVAGVMFWRFPPAGLMWIAVLAALGIGAAPGWQRGRMMRISVNPETHEISQKASPAAMLFIVGLIVVRMGAREAAAMGGSSFHADLTSITDILIAFALGLLATQRIEMVLRARRLLEEARAGA
ncbi:CcdC protein domain-containing protein [Sphingomonas sp. dw_22]|uniref:CcdC protein domain-containing protein n=1 Tax=Sphingomonas sp. dw_22 TaxID=2721175 RepID=UPI001BD28893|nr:CcdC protein domain-containing protein [Sphingomonas sp. dw_22]